MLSFLQKVVVTRMLDETNQSTTHPMVRPHHDRDRAKLNESWPIEPSHASVIEGSSAPRPGLDEGTIRGNAR